MSTITLTFTNTINSSIQVGDTAYYCDVTDLGSNQVALINPAITTSVTTVPDGEATAYPYTHWWTGEPLPYAISIVVDPPNPAIQPGQMVTADDVNGVALVNGITAAPEGVFVSSVVPIAGKQIVYLWDNNLLFGSSSFAPGGRTWAATIVPGALTNVEFWDYIPPKGAIEIGKIQAISNNQIVCRGKQGIVPPTTDSFILFSKDNVANLSGVRGYFSEIEIRNNSTEGAEMFGVGCDIFESSK